MIKLHICSILRSSLHKLDKMYLELFSDFLLFLGSIAHSAIAHSAKHHPFGGKTSLVRRKIAHSAWTSFIWRPNELWWLRTHVAEWAVAHSANVAHSADSSLIRQLLSSLCVKICALHLRAFRTVGHHTTHNNWHIKISQYSHKDCHGA